MKFIAHLQPFIPHYREEFFKLLGEKVNQDVFIYENIRKAEETSFKIGSTKCTRISSKLFKGGILFYNPIKLLSHKYDTLILMLNFTHITSWLILLTKFLHHKKIILWGQGISVKRYLKEEKKVDWKLKLMIRLADGVWIYMAKEANQWKSIFPEKPIVALNNTLSGVDQMTTYSSSLTTEALKAKYNIKQTTILIFCARFNAFRRTDLLLETIQRLDKNKFGFIIIGDGDSKPDFSIFNNVYDFGALYDTEIKRELFTLSDIYFQPGWVGLSIVEAMAYGLPIFTFKRSKETHQCVEYSYIKEGNTGIIMDNIDDCIKKVSSISKDKIRYLGENARSFVKGNLSMDKMVNHALVVLNQV